MTILQPYLQPCRPLLLASLLIATIALDSAAEQRCPTCIASLDQLSIPALRARDYHSSPEIISQLGDHSSNYSAHHAADGSAPYSTFMASYLSDGLRLYSRIDIPVTPMPASGYPVLIFAHGWVGKDKARTYDFAYNETSHYGEIIDFHVDAGFIVLTPGYRGHGTVNTIPADGIEFMHSWDNGSYLMPSFYSIDVLNLIAGLPKFQHIAWQDWGIQTPPTVNLQRVHLLAHSQGGDVALGVMAVSGEGASLSPAVKSASIWAGNIPDRFTQAETFGPMGSTLQAFMSGDGSWTGTAIGRKGEVNANFVFPWPSDWIATLDRTSTQWSWQEENWSLPTVESAISAKYQQMYSTLKQQISDSDYGNFTISHDDKGKLTVTHPESLRKTMLSIGGYHATQWLSEPLALHTSDRDYYSLPEWNQDLAKRINTSGGNAHAFIYQGNTHSLRRSEHLWFSPVGTKAGYPYALRRDLLLFSDKNPATLKFP